MRIGKREILVLILSVVCYFLFVAWKIQIIPSSIERFIGNYGLHGIGTFGFTLWCQFCLRILRFSPISKEWKIPKLVKNEKKYIFRMVISIWAGALFNELVQFLDPKRVIDVWDVLAQTVGSLAALILLVSLGYHKRA